MSRRITASSALLLAGLLTATGCSFLRSGKGVSQNVDVGGYQFTATQIDDPTVETVGDPVGTTPPLTIDGVPEDYWNMSLEEAIRLAMQNSPVLRDLDGTVLRAPETTRTRLNPAVTETDPRFGVESALSAFDTSFATSAFFEKNDRALNNIFFGGGTRTLEQDTFIVQSQLAKRAVTGTELSLRNEMIYDANNAPGNAFGGAYDFNPEVVLRHPLLQGSGIEFNRIAGPSQTAGLYGGVVIARINTDVELADFQIGVRNFVNDVENAYWDLHYAYRDLDARIRARDEALALWQTVYAWYETGRAGGDAASEAQAREQYYRFEEEVQNSLTGRLLEPTATNSGSPGGTFRPNGGVLVAERRLRLLLGVPLADGRAIRPVDEPPSAEIDFDWHDSIAESLSRRTEIRRQKWLVKRRELELRASRNFLKPEFDVVGRYRWRGFGKDLIQQHDNDTFITANGAAASPFNSALGTLSEGDFQEWQLGFEFSMPFGFRQGHAAVRNAELQLARERTILHEQEREIAHDLGDAFSELRRAHAVLKTSYNRFQAAKAQYAALKAVYEEGEETLTKEQLYVLLESQRRWTDAEVAFARSSVEYALAVKNVHFEKGSLLDYDQVVLEEGIWPAKAYQDAKEKASRRKASRSKLRTDWPVSRGPAPQLVTGPGEMTVEAPQDVPGEGGMGGNGYDDSAQPMPPAPTEPPKPAAEPKVELPETSSTEAPAATPTARSNPSSSGTASKSLFDDDWTGFTSVEK